MNNYEFGRGKDKTKRKKRGFGQRLDVMRRKLQVGASRFRDAVQDPNNATKAKMKVKGAVGEGRLLAGTANRKRQDVQRGAKKQFDSYADKGKRGGMNAIMSLAKDGSRRLESGAKQQTSARYNSISTDSGRKDLMRRGKLNSAIGSAEVGAAKAAASGVRRIKRLGNIGRKKKKDNK